MRLLLLAAAACLAAWPAAALDAYWIEPAYKAYPLEGPEKAHGYAVWNHGVKGSEPQYQYPPMPVMEALAARGWDVVKLNRNPIWENSWSNAGKLHVERNVAEIAAARAKGYRRVVVGGQSYGGAIALETATRADGLWGVVATAPGTGQEMQFGSLTDRWSYAIAQQSYDQIRRMRPTRAVLVFPKGDQFISIERGAEARHLLGAAMPYLVIDETASLSGHGAAATAAFRPYATCIAWFLDPGSEPKPGAFQCGRDELRQVLAALGAKFPPAEGQPFWFGYFGTIGQEVLLGLRPDKEAGRVADYAWGRGPNAKFSTGIRSFPVSGAGDAVSFELSSGAKVTTGPEPGGALRLVYEKEGQNRLEAVLQKMTR
jgi:pimeloyl-ACP methyl ester carboxylesterase